MTYIVAGASGYGAYKVKQVLNITDKDYRRMKLTYNNKETEENTNLYTDKEIEVIENSGGILPPVPA